LCRLRDFIAFPDHNVYGVLPAWAILAGNNIGGNDVADLKIGLVCNVAVVNKTTDA
jgi:hypothetical protein